MNIMRYLRKQPQRSIKDSNMNMTNLYRVILDLEIYIHLLKAFYELLRIQIYQILIRK